MATQAARRVLLKLLLVVMIVSVSSAEQQSTVFVDEPMLARLAEQHGEQAKRRGEALNALLQELADKDVKQQLREVNRFFNQFQYKEDIEIWGQKDYWATPEEFIGLNRGDCEDFVVAKYFVLRALGVPDEQLYLTYVKAVRKNVAHMVLSYFSTPKSVPLILDNYNQKILPATQRRDLLPVYSFNAGSLFLTNASAGLGRALPTDRIKNNKWQKLLANVKRARP
jgi:predicted transglutaminase-like cysteine proteinase